MPDQDPSNDPAHPKPSALLNYRSGVSGPKTKPFSIFRVLGMLLLIFVLVGLLIFGICTWSVLHA